MYNRAKLDQTLAEETKRCRAAGLVVSIALLDIDHFKAVNDTWGHQVGDDTLVAIARVLTQCLSNPCRVGRWSGEEFMLICPEQTLEQITDFAQSVRAAIANHRFQTVQHITVSIGVAVLRDDENMHSLVSRSAGQPVRLCSLSR